ncbi:MAG: recombinase family protein [Actinomycetota bacterium]
MIRAAIYARVSTDDQNCDRQIADLTDFAGRAGYQIISIHRETASGAKTDRAERKKVMSLAQSRKIAAVLVTEASRWSRSTVDLLTTLQSLNAWGVSLVTMSGIGLDLNTPTGKLMASVLAAISEFERDLIRERVKSGMATARSKGQKFGRPPLTAEAIAQVHQLRAEGKSYSEIAKLSGVSRTKVAELCRLSC